MEVEQRDDIPKWYYGYSHKEINRQCYNYYIIPFNYVIRWAMTTKELWDRYKSKPNYMDRLVDFEVQERTKWLEDIIHDKDVMIAELLKLSPIKQ